MDYKFETRCIHRENEHEEGHPYGSVCTPIYQTATFYHPGIGQTTGFNIQERATQQKQSQRIVVTSLEEAKGYSSLCKWYGINCAVHGTV